MTRPKAIILAASASLALLASGYLAGEADRETKADLSFIAGKADPVSAINRSVNRVRPGDELNAKAADGAWDCEDFAFAKLAALEATGITGARVWRVITGQGQAHAIVLLADGRVMDNLFSDTPQRAQLERVNGYRFERPMVSAFDVYPVQLALVGPKVEGR